MKYTRPKVPTEARVVFELCHVLRLSGVDFDLEYHVKNRNNGRFQGRRGDRKSCRFDVVLIKDGSVVGILEAKRSRLATGSSAKVTGFQIHEYRKVTGSVPIFCFYGFEEKAQALKFCERVTGVQIKTS